MEASNHFDHMIFDLDNTLYEQKSHFFEQVKKRMSLFIQKKLRLSADEADALRHYYFQTYNTTLNGLMANGHPIDPYEYLDFVHDVAMDEIHYNPRLDGLLNEFKHHKVIFTNGPRKHAEKVIQKLGIERHFDNIISIETNAFIPKPHDRAYTVLNSQYGVNSQRALFFEDISENLLPAADRGMTTVLIRTDCEKAMKYHNAPEIHYQSYNVEQFLQSLL
jgi:putative hydrolase of the HAD superfamily